MFILETLVGTVCKGVSLLIDGAVSNGIKTHGSE